MKKTPLFMMLVGSSILALEAHATHSLKEEKEEATHLSQRLPGSYNNSEIEKNSPYNFELIGDIISNQDKLSARFRITLPQEPSSNPVESILDLVEVSSLGFRAYLPEGGLPADPSQNLPLNIGTAKERVKCSFNYEGQMHACEIARSEEFPLQGKWESTEDRDFHRNLFTLKLSALKEGRLHEVSQDNPHQIEVPHTLVASLEQERIGIPYFDGDNTYLGRIVPQRWKNPTSGEEYTYHAATRDSNVESHQGHEMIYVEPFSLGKGPQKERGGYRGEYKFVRDLDPKERLPGRDLGSLVYSDGKEIFLPHVTQELWQGDESQVGFFIASYKRDQSLKFISPSPILQNGRFPEGLYQFVTIKEENNRRIEAWKKLGDDSSAIEIETPLGVASIPGMGLHAFHNISSGNATPEVVNLHTAIQASERSLQSLDSYPQAKESVVVVGPTGSGKSTLIHLLAHKRVRTVEDERGLHLEPEELLSGFNISHSDTTGTTIPTVWFDETHNRVLIDCAGFGDVRGAELDLVNAFAIYKILTYTKKLKVLLVTKEGILTERTAEYPKLLADLTQLFQDDDKLHKSITFAVTKHRDARINGLLAKKLKEANDSKSENRLSDRSKNLIEFLANNPNRIATVPYPSREGDYILDDQAIQEALNAAQPVTYTHLPHVLPPYNRSRFSFVVD